MRVTTIPSILTISSLLACGGQYPTGGASESFDAQSLSAQLNGAVPLKGKCEATMAPPSVASPGIIRQVDAGTCELSHLGHVTFYSDKVINVVAGTQVTQATFAAPNGDSIYVSGSGSNTQLGGGIVGFTTELTLDRGTGRFENVSGEAHVTGEANVVSRSSTLSLTGSITYAASDARPN